MKQNPKIVIFGAGAIGGSAGAWIAKLHSNTLFLARGEHALAMRENGIALTQINHPESREVIHVHVLNNISETADADVVIIAVKNYSLEDAAKKIRLATGDRPVIVGMQNGLANQTILPRYFSKVILLRHWLQRLDRPAGCDWLSQ